MRVVAQPGPQRLEFEAASAGGGKFLRPAVKSTTFDVILRPCTLGEITNSANTECKKCGVNMVSLNSSAEDCVKCPDSASCPGGYIMVPQPGFWHSSPFSDNMIQCPLPSACDRTTMTSNDISTDANSRRLRAQDGTGSDMDALATLQASLAPLLPRYNRSNQSWPRQLFAEHPGVLAQYMLAQCAEGYTGNLCAVCRNGFGKTTQGCAACLSRDTSILLYSLALLIPVVFMGFSMFVEVAATQDMMLARTTIARAVARDRPVWWNNASAGGSNRGFQLESSVDGLEALRMRARAPLPSASPDGQGGDEPCIQDEETRAAALELKRAVAKIDGFGPSHSSVLKLAVSYIQVTCIVWRVPIPWMYYLQVFFQCTSSIAASTDLIVPLDCCLQDMEQPSIAAQNVIVSSSLLFVFCAFFLLIGVIVATVQHRASRRKKDGPTYASRLKLAACLIVSIVVFYMYPAVTQAILSIFSCTQVDPVDTSSTGFFMLNQGLYWMSDMDQRCYEGSHTTLAIAYGVPWLVLFCIGVPLGTALVVICHRKSIVDFQEPAAFHAFVTKTYDTSFMECFASTYKDFTPELAYWEAVIILRKLLVVAAIVLLNSMQQQLLMISFVVTVSLCLQVIYMPFKDNPGRARPLTRPVTSTWRWLKHGWVTLVHNPCLAVGHSNGKLNRQHGSAYVTGHSPYTYSRHSMNWLETTSLMCTLITLYGSAGIISTTDEQVINILSGIILFVNVYILAYFLYCLVTEWIWGVMRLYDTNNSLSMSTSDWILFLLEKPLAQFLMRLLCCTSKDDLRATITKRGGHLPLTPAMTMTRAGSAATHASHALMLASPRTPATNAHNDNETSHPWVTLSPAEIRAELREEGSLTHRHRTGSPQGGQEQHCSEE